MYQLEDMRARGSKVFINKFRRNEKHENINMLIKTTVA